MIANSKNSTDPFGQLPPDDIVFGRTPEMLALRDKLQRVARSNVPVLINGESGTGKEIIAKLVHRYSAANGSPFVKVNCPAIPGTLLESELFGYERGAFTGAYADKPGRVELADGGTLFLDEISELDASLQSKLLQVLQDGQFCRIGAQEDQKVDVRLVCATNRDMQEETELGRFRRDLFYRIAVVTLSLPPLRHRIADLPEMTRYLLNVQQQKLNGTAKPISPSVIRQMQLYAWPGNIRQLENVIKRYVILGTDDVILAELAGSRTEDLRVAPDGACSLRSLTRQAVRKLEAQVILGALESNHWNRKRAARALNISYRGLLYKLKEVGIAGPRSRSTVVKTQPEESGPVPVEKGATDEI
ncbi:MAG TPA: sigma-54 dependent transcriptional regulator [Clostridia bacterium]|nr:sigma-54 dependent transcriptional regulator [Clostridia bacterium]